MELEESAHDPNRLFGNRGGALLKEEKERRKVKLVGVVLFKVQIHVHICWTKRIEIGSMS